MDLKLPQYETSKADEFEILDLRRFEDCLLAARGGIDQIYNLAADMAVSVLSQRTMHSSLETTY